MLFTGQKQFCSSFDVPVIADLVQLSDLGDGGPVFAGDAIERITTFDNMITLSSGAYSRAGRVPFINRFAY